MRKIWLGRSGVRRRAPKARHLNGRFGSDTLSMGWAIHVMRVISIDDLYQTRDCLVKLLAFNSEAEPRSSVRPSNASVETLSTSASERPTYVRQRPTAGHLAGSALFSCKDCCSELRRPKRPYSYSTDSQFTAQMIICTVALALTDRG